MCVCVCARARARARARTRPASAAGACMMYSGLTVYIYAYMCKYICISSLAKRVDPLNPLDTSRYTARLLA